MKKLLVVAVVTLFIISASVVIFSASGSDTAARKEIKYITEFNPDVESAELKFPQGGGSDSSLNITVPKRSKVLAARDVLCVRNERVY